MAKFTLHAPKTQKMRPHISIGRVFFLAGLAIAALSACGKDRSPPPKKTYAVSVSLPKEVGDQPNEILNAFNIEPEGAALTKEQLSQLSAILGQMSAYSASLDKPEPRLPANSRLFLSLDATFESSSAWHLISFRAHKTGSIELLPVAAFVQLACENQSPPNQP
jgi:hypothetical protein